MLIPTKYENLNRNILIVGYKITRKLKIQPYNIDILFQIIKKEENISLETYYDTITFLWLSGIINKEKYQLFLKK